MSSLNCCPPRRHRSSETIVATRSDGICNRIPTHSHYRQRIKQDKAHRTNPTNDSIYVASPIPRDRPVVVHLIREGGTSRRMISKRFRPSVGKRRKTRRAIRCRAVGLAFRFTTCVWIGAAAGEIQYVNLHVMLSVGVCSYCSSWVSLRKKRAVKNLLVGLAV
jgi:hypothetical protein